MSVNNIVFYVCHILSHFMFVNNIVFYVCHMLCHFMFVNNVLYGCDMLWRPPEMFGRPTLLTRALLEPLHGFFKGPHLTQYVFEHRKSRHLWMAEKVRSSVTFQPSLRIVAPISVCHPGSLFTMSLNHIN